MIRKSDENKDIFLVSSANWEIVLDAENESFAVSEALSRVYEKYKDKLSLSTTISVFNVSKSYKKMIDIDNISFFHTPASLADAGFHDLASKYSEFFKSIKNES